MGTEIKIMIKIKRERDKHGSESPRLANGCQGGVHDTKTPKTVDGQTLKENMDIPAFGRLHFSKQDPKTVIMADPIRFTKENIDQYDFGI
jgi:hypothetical protein